MSICVPDGERKTCAHVITTLSSMRTPVPPLYDSSLGSPEQNLTPILTTELSNRLQDVSCGVLWKPIRLLISHQHHEQRFRGSIGSRLPEELCPAGPYSVTLILYLAIRSKKQCLVKVLACILLGDEDDILGFVEYHNRGSRKRIDKFPN
jgi:hypothetical protein